MALYDTIDLIIQQIAQQIIDASISGINGVVLDRALKSGTTHPPYLRIFLDPSPIEDITMGAGGEIWVIRYTIQAVTNPSADADSSQARDLALQASSAIIADRSLNNTANQDTRRIAFTPNFNKEIDNDQLHGAAVTMETQTILHLT